MIKGIGTDIVQIARMKLELAPKILSEQEIAVFTQFSSETRKREYLAGRFAVKEAITKALASTTTRVGFTEMAILHQSDGRPYLDKPILKGLEAWLSITHEKDYAFALCVLEADEVQDSKRM